MFGLSLSSPTADRIDPYWYSRLSGLKVGFAAILFFLINGFLKSPQFPVMSMLVAGACVILTEMPAFNTHKKKDLIFIGFFILVVLTINIFGACSYFRVGLLLGVGGWAYALYTLLAKNAHIASLVGTLMLIGLVSMQGQPPTDLHSILNEDLFFLEYALAGFLACKVFPNLYDRIVLSATLRLLERDIHFLGRGEGSHSFRRAVLRDLAVIRNALALQHSSVREFVEDVQSLQLLVVDLAKTPDLHKEPLACALRDLHTAISTRQSYTPPTDVTEALSRSYPLLSVHFHRTVLSWNTACSAVR